MNLINHIQIPYFINKATLCQIGNMSGINGHVSLSIGGSGSDFSEKLESTYSEAFGEVVEYCDKHWNLLFTYGRIGQVIG